MQGRTGTDYRTNYINQSPSLQVNISLSIQQVTHDLSILQDFIVVFITDYLSSLSWAITIKSTPSQPYLRSILILSIHLCLVSPSGFFPSSFTTEALQIFRFSLMPVTRPSHLLLLLEIITHITFCNDYETHRSSLCNSLHPLLLPNSQVQTSSSAPDSKTPSAHVLPRKTRETKSLYPRPVSPPPHTHIKQRAVPRLYYLTFRISDGRGEDWRFWQY